MDQLAASVVGGRDGDGRGRGGEGTPTPDRLGEYTGRHFEGDVGIKILA